MEEKIDIERIMDEIRAEAKAQSAYEPAAYVQTEAGKGQKIKLSLRNLAHKLRMLGKRWIGGFLHIVGTLGLIARYHLKWGQGILEDTQNKTRDLSAYVHGDLEKRLEQLERENEQLRQQLAARAGEEK